MYIVKNSGNDRIGFDWWNNLLIHWNDRIRTTVASILDVRWWSNGNHTVQKLYSKKKKKLVDVTSQNNRQNYKSADLLRSILGQLKGSMTKQTDEWWKGLGEELETDIEALTDKTENS